MDRVTATRAMRSDTPGISGEMDKPTWLSDAWGSLLAWLLARKRLAYAVNAVGVEDVPRESDMETSTKGRSGIQQGWPIEPTPTGCCDSQMQWRVAAQTWAPGQKNTAVRVWMQIWVRARCRCQTCCTPGCRMRMYVGGWRLGGK